MIKYFRQRMLRFTLRCLRAFVVLILLQVAAHADKGYSNQLWFNIILDYPWSKKLFLELDIEPKLQVNGEETWRNLDATGLIEYYPNSWLDLTGELTTGVTKQLEKLNTFEMTPRLGLRIHLFSTVKEVLEMERAPLKRVGLSNLARLEVRRFSYSDNRPAEYEFRLRNRLELKIAINHERINIDRTFYFMSDMENFIPLSGEAANRFSSKARFRFGFGYRFSYTWRAEFLYLVDKARDTLEEEFDVTAEAVNFRVKINF
jgi:hypothetical protein